MTQIDPDKSQAWAVTCCFEDIYHTHLMVLQGTLGEILPQVHHLAERTGGVCKVFALTPTKLLARSDHYFSAMQEVVGAMICHPVAKVNRDFKFNEWKAAFRHVFEELPPEQLKVELVNFQLRVEKELNALRIREEMTTKPETQSPPVLGIVTEKVEGKPEHICSSCGIALADTWQPNYCAPCLARRDAEEKPPEL